MTRIHDVIDRYARCRMILSHGVDIFAVGDPAGAQLNVAIRRLLYQAGDEGGSWDDLIRVANALRWRRVTQPQPNAYAPAVADAVRGVVREAQLLRGLVGDQSLLERVIAAATEVGATDSPVGSELVRSVQEVGFDCCVVVAASGPARAGVLSWLQQFGVKVAVPSELSSLPTEIEQSYVLGPPSFFPASLVTAPATEAVTYVMPAWFGNRAVPASALATHAEGGIAVHSRLHSIGDLAEPPSEIPNETEIEDTFFPQVVWQRSSPAREPKSDEVEAWKVLLGGGLALWLDDGERIRSLDPRQPEGDRISYEAVEDVQPGTYLVLREGATEHRAMYDAALAATGPRALNITMTQEQWKQALAERLQRDGVTRAIVELSARNVRAASRVRAWTEPTLICPKREEDLAVLLGWLGLPLQPTYTNAVYLRRVLYQAIADLRQELEDAVAQSDLHALERDGILHLELQREGFRGMIVAKVLARAPFTEIVPRSQTRVPFYDSGAQWLE